MRLRVRRPIRLVVIGVAVGLVLGGCGSEQPGTAVIDSSGAASLGVSGSSSPSGTAPASSPAPDTSSAPPTSTSASAAPATTSPTNTALASTSGPPESSTASTQGSTTASEPAGDLMFGTTYTWADGISLRVSAPKHYEPSNKDRSKAKAFVRFEITVRNDSRRPYLTGYGVPILVESQGEQAYNVVDIELPERPRIALLPGQSGSWIQAYGVQSANNVQLEIAPTSWDDQVTFATDGTRHGGQQPGPDNTSPPTVGLVKFGGKYTYADGLVVRVGGPQPYDPSDTALGTRSKKYLKFHVTVVNGTRETLDPYAMTFGAAQNGRQVGSVNDPAGGIDQRPKGSVPPGNKFSTIIAFGVKSAKNLTVEIAFLHENPVVFTNVAVPEYITSEKAGGHAPESSPGQSTKPGRTTAPGTSTVERDIALAGGFEAVFGKKINWTNGVSMSVSAPKPATADPGGVRVPKGSKAVAVTVTVHNGSNEPLTELLIAEASSKQVPAITVVDAEHDFLGGSLDVEPGGTQKIRVGFWVLDPTQVIVRLRPASRYDYAFFTSDPAHRPTKVQPTGSEKDPTVVGFGTRYVYTDGVAVTVDKRAAEPVGQAAGDSGTSWIAIAATVTNNSDRPVKITFSPIVMSGNVRSERFSDPVNGIIGAQGNNSVLPGRTMTFTIGFEVADPKDVTAQYSYLFEEPRVVWST